LTATATSLDTLSERSLAGDRQAESALFEALRVRFLTIAKQRVQQDHAEDLVQDTLGIVFDRYGERKQGQGILVWGLTVLRNVIGNYYQARDRERDRLSFVDELPATAVQTGDALSDTVACETRDRLLDAIAALGKRFPRCGRIFGSLLTSLARGGSPNEVSTRALVEIQRTQPELSRGGFYTALHRCRAHLRGILGDLEDDTRQGVEHG